MDIRVLVSEDKKSAKAIITITDEEYNIIRGSVMLSSWASIGEVKHEAIEKVNQQFKEFEKKL